MKNALIVFALLLSSVTASAQKHYLYTDVGISLAYLDPGFSATYNYNPIKWISIGAGGQLHNFHTTMTTPRLYTPAVYGELRFRIRPERISQYFIFIDLGMNFYTHSNATWVQDNYMYNATKDNGTYLGLGTGYFLRLTHKGGGAYVSVKLISNSYKTNAINLSTNEKSIKGAGDATMVVSLGFRFGHDNKDFGNYISNH